MGENKPTKYERNRRIIDKPSKVERLWNPYNKIRETVDRIVNDK